MIVFQDYNIFKGIAGSDWVGFKHFIKMFTYPELLLRVGHVLDANVEQILAFLNPLVSDVGEVVNTYIYRVGLLGAQFSYTTAIGVFKSVISLLLIAGLNYISRKSTGESIY